MSSSAAEPHPPGDGSGAPRGETSRALRCRVRGVVQGVGFRPFVWRLARELGLAGYVRNDGDGVDLVVGGPDDAIDTFLRRLRQEAPLLARIDAVVIADTLPPSNGFLILDSRESAVRTAIGADTAVCGACLGDLFDPANRRHRYAFTTCTHCGPRYTVARRLPYDRAHTSLAPFPLCPDCRREYGDPADRRFHAEATCCPRCGPTLRLRGADGADLAGEPIAATLRLLRAGGIVAIKGLGGFHLACDARRSDTVAALRRRKAREAKPLAVMAASPRVFEPLVAFDDDALAALKSRAAPIVLVDKTAACDQQLAGVAPGVGALGVILPNTPLQWLLFHEAAGAPPGVGWIDDAPPELVLVMTSANPRGEPIVIDDEQALTQLAGLADAVLGHDRAIVARADDSVRAGGGFVRRARGYVPEAIRLPAAGPSVLAFGGWYKNTVCLTRDDQAFVSTHVGDLDNAAACRFLDETVARLLDLTGIEPTRVAHDAHPDFYSTHAARRYAGERGLPAIAVYHHHAHLAAVFAEHGQLAESGEGGGSAAAVGLALDGVGLGTDGTAWGGELLRVDGATCQRLGHLAPLPLPGGDRAAREPWRLAAAVLWRLGRGDEIVVRHREQAGAAVVRQMLERGLNCPPTSSAGRYFDAAAGLLGVMPRADYEGQAAMALEALAERHGACPPLAGGWRVEHGVLELLPLFAALADETDAARGAAFFHATLGAALADWVGQVAFAEKSRGLPCAGGCWLNRRLWREFAPRVAAAGFTPLLPRQLPPGDGGLALGQAWVAMQTAIAGDA